MLFSYTLIFSLFTTFVAAAPASSNIQFLVGGGGEWAPTMPMKRILQVGTKITFTEVKDDNNKKVVFRFTNEAGYDSGELSAGKISSSYPPEVVAGLCITEWQHGATDSIISFSKASDGNGVRLRVVHQGSYQGAKLLMQMAG